MDPTRAMVGGPGGNGATADLDTPPPMPPAGQRNSLFRLAGTTPEGEGLGPAASDPQVMAMQGFQMIKMGAQMLGVALPVVSGPVTAFVEQLKQVIPQAMAGAMTGGAAPPPPGAGGAMPPVGPPPAPMAGAPPAGGGAMQ